MSSDPALCAALVTPFDDKGQVDQPRFLDHAAWVLRNGCDGVTVFGTTGEAASVPLAARMAALEALVEGGLPAQRVIVGTGCCSVGDTVSLSRHALSLGCHGVLVHPPFFFNAPGENGVFEFYSRVVEGIGTDQARIFLYHFPEITGVPIEPSLVERLLTSFGPVFAGIKDSSGSWDNMAALVKAFPQLRVFSGDDHLLWPILQAGGAGAITATANLTPQLLQEVAKGWQDNRPEARAAQETLVGLWENTLLKFPVVEAVKELMAHKSGVSAWRTLCPPLAPLAPTLRHQLLSMSEPYLGDMPAGLGLSSGEATPR